MRAAAEEEWYSVQSGDTIESIAAQFGVSTEAIIKRNGLARTSAIVARQILIIPATEALSLEQAESEADAVEGIGRSHIVRRGETLQRIAALYGLDWWTLASANNISNPNLIYAGQALVVPAAGQRDSTPAAVATPQPASLVERPGLPSTSQRQYRIYIAQYSDDFDRIGQRFAVAPAALLNVNGFVGRTPLYVGDVLLIPASSSRASVTSPTAVAVEGIQHIVQRGETLAIIAARYGRALAEIVLANSISNPNRIDVGQVLIIP